MARTSTARTRLALLCLLAPNIATFTVACPHCIPATAVMSVANGIRKVVPPLAQPQPPPRTVDISFLPEPVTEHKPRILVRSEDTWRSVATFPEDLDLATAEISDARLDQSASENGGMEWHVEAPITFSYRVREELDVLDPASDALIFGHLKNDAAALARAHSRPLKRVVVVDEAVYEHYGARIEAYFEHHDVETKMLVLPTTEENKNMDLVLTIAQAVHELGLDRRLDPVIAIGGGVCMDIVGFAASIYRRRTPYVRVPTTLMGYIDASIGAKSGVNFYTTNDGWRKNKLGSYMPPELTLLDRSFLGTLDQRQLSNGAAEIAKMAMMKDPELFRLLHDHGSELIKSKFQDNPLRLLEKNAEPSAPSRVLYLAIQTMLEELAPNLMEDSLERLVDFGHVFSMELEMAMLHEDKLFHGEAVAIDMAYSACLSYVRGHLSETTLEETLDMMRGLELPIYHPSFDAALVNEAMYERIKFSQGQKIPLPVGEGVARIFNDITKEQLIDALDVWESRCAPHA